MKLRKEFFPVLPLLALAACTHEVEKTDAKWTVKTSTDRDQKIWVSRSDGSLQCGQRAPAPADVARQVQSAGVLVYQSRTGNDGQMHSQRCGSPTGHTIDLLISRPDLRKVLALGFVTKAEPDAN